jgi:hypothetical protein
MTTDARRKLAASFLLLTKLSVNNRIIDKAYMILAWPDRDTYFNLLEA